MFEYWRKSQKTFHKNIKATIKIHTNTNNTMIKTNKKK